MRGPDLYRFHPRCPKPRLAEVDVIGARFDSDEAVDSNFVCGCFHLNAGGAIRDPHLDVDNHGTACVIDDARDESARQLSEAADTKSDC
jgi:hypothetical protein